MLKKNCMIRSCMMFIYCHVLLADQMEECAIGRACGLYRVKGKAYRVGGEIKKKDCFEDLGIDGTIRLNCTWYLTGIGWCVLDSGLCRI
jgi:hypothetical protein